MLIEGTVIFFQKRSDNLDKAEGLILHDGDGRLPYRPPPYHFPNGTKFDLAPDFACAVSLEELPTFPILSKPSWKSCIKGKLPEPRRVTAKELFSSGIDSDWIEVEALVVGVAPGGLGFTLVVEIDGLTFLAELPKVVDAAVQAETLMQKRVLLRGIVGSITSMNRQLTDRYFFVPSFDPADSNRRKPGGWKGAVAHDH